MIFFIIFLFFTFVNQRLEAYPIVYKKSNGAIIVAGYTSAIDRYKNDDNYGIVDIKGDQIRSGKLSLYIYDENLKIIKSKPQAELDQMMNDKKLKEDTNMMTYLQQEINTKIYLRDSQTSQVLIDQLNSEITILTNKLNSIKGKY